MKTIRIQSADSTNSWLARESDSTWEDCLVYAVEQTAGRGQRGNCWESEPGKNLTASALLHPEGILPQEQFVISEAVALAVCDILEEEGVRAMVKWPNDIYCGDRKICGILIEHSVMPGAITRTIAGVGINVNQTRFVSDAPNPVSLKQLTGRARDVAALAGRLASRIGSRLRAAQSDRNGIHAEFMGKLWRGDGEFHPFADRRAGENITARIAGVAPDGIMTLVTDGGERRSYAFKEIEFIL